MFSRFYFHVTLTKNRHSVPVANNILFFIHGVIIASAMFKVALCNAEIGISVSGLSNFLATKMGGGAKGINNSRRLNSNRTEIILFTRNEYSQK